jgi:glutathione synthase/RimK-type ligase-like ATP-grasp enzyme
MQIFDLAVAYTWKYDIEFINLIEKLFQKNGLKTFIIYKQNIHEVASLLRQRKLLFKAYLDRASDEDPEFEIITKLLIRKRCYLINPHKKTKKATDKSYFHKKLLRKNFRLPKTFIIESFDKSETLYLSDANLKELKIPFIIKPAIFSGGGQGVVKDASSIEQIQTERMKGHNEKYLIQEKVHPVKLENKRAWFRVFWAFGKVIPTWWDDHTHIYHTLTKEQIAKYKLQQLIKITQRLARVANIDYFSTEIVLAKNHQFILIDYINDQCDMRLQSLHVDGVPDVVVTQFIEQMRRKVSAL